MLAGNEEKKRRRRSPKYPEDSAPGMPTNAIATTHQNNQKRKCDVKEADKHRIRKPSGLDSDSDSIIAGESLLLGARLDRNRLAQWR